METKITWMGAIFVTICFIASSISSATGPRRMRVLAIGEVDTSYCPVSAFLVAEPSLDGTLAVARDMHGTNFGEKGLKRIIRLYIPRNLEAMLGYDFILINQPVVKYFETTSLEQMNEAIVQHGRGGLCFMESQYFDIYGPWLETELSKCFPYDHYANLRLGAPGDEIYDLEVVRDPILPPLLMPYVPLGIESIKPFGGSRPTYEKEGATVWAYCRTHSFHGRYPLFISWRYGSGRALVWVTADQFDSPMWRTNDGKERYALDILTGMIWLSSGWELPNDPVRVHVLRDSFSQLQSRVSLVTSVIEFIDSFGANTRQIETDLGDLLALGREAGDMYLDHEFESCESVLAEAFSFAARIETKSILLKKQALSWVYLIEWLSVTSAIALAGWAAWMLMVKRMMYRAVAITRKVSE